ncbi:MAG TPA: hypothetical protein VK335_03755 [Bryobacteraceae bacterium]|nr:hypothetical protein [Terriglobales bacterium]HLM98367.1 hypothetical protein [Bryobacteraceae bacterium]
MKTAILVLLAIGIVVYSLDTIEPRYPPGILIPEEPNQQLTNGTRAWKMGQYQVTALAAYEIRARVLHTESYWLDHGADLSPIDLAVGWGRMSDQSIVDQLEFWQGQRWYRYWPRKSKFPLSADDMNSHSANMHMIPANDGVKRSLKSVMAGNLVEMDGYLVQVDGPDGFTWRSSLSRTDTGAGACELFRVEKLTIH